MVRREPFLPAILGEEQFADIKITIKERALKSVQFCSSSRKAKFLTAGIHQSISRIARKLHCVPKFEPDAEIGQKGTLYKALKELL